MLPKKYIVPHAHTDASAKSQQHRMVEHYADTNAVGRSNAYSLGYRTSDVYLSDMSVRLRTFLILYILLPSKCTSDSYEMISTEVVESLSKLQGNYDKNLQPVIHYYRISYIYPYCYL